MSYRTKTYLAGDWTGDKNAIDQLHKWNESNYWNLHFVDVHDFMQSNDNSRACSIKKSLSERMDMCKTFVLVVGDKTNKLTRGSCYNCSYYDTYAAYLNTCKAGNSISNKSFIQFECDKAYRDKDYLKIVVLYNSRYVYRERCPEVIRDVGKHIPMIDSNGYWNYTDIRDAIMS